MWRIIDANLDRVAEGLRVLEDVARFFLDDLSLSQRLKSMRHELLELDYSLQLQSLASRRAEEDVGSSIDVPGEGQRQDLPALVMANSRRVQEALRVLEEFAKLPPSALEAKRFKQARFALYELEQRLVFRLWRKEKSRRLTGVYLVLDIQALKGRSEIEVARQAIQGGARTIQLRDKRQDKRGILKTAAELKRLCAQREVLFIVNDYLDIALACEADGLHLGQKDLPLPVARKILPPDRLLGCSTATVTEALQAKEDGADYVAVGSLFPTASKEDTRPAGLETLRQVKEAVSLPIVGIGGINETNIEAVVRAGATGVAVISAILVAEDVEKATCLLSAKLEQTLLSTGGQSGNF